MNASSWLAELQFENDNWLKSYIYSGITEGFAIDDDGCQIASYDAQNYRSVSEESANNFVKNLMISELTDEKYVVVGDKPKCIHALGVIPKVSGGYRVITDCKRPEGISINSHMDNTGSQFSYTTVDYVQSLFSPGSFGATIDIELAYRSISVNPKHGTYQGVQWRFPEGEKYMVDTRLCFGLRSAPLYFHPSKMSGT